MCKDSRKYQWIDHTADLALRVYGRSAQDLYENAAVAMFDRITDRGRLQGKISQKIRIEGTDRADLMVNWLRELLYQWNGKETLVKSVRIDRLSRKGLGALVMVDPFDEKRHEIRAEIKAVTYHQIRITQNRDGWEATIVFDV